MDHLLDKIGRLRAHVESQKAHEAATAEVLAIAKAEIAIDVTVAKKPGVAQSKESPVRQRTKRAANNEEEAPLETLLRNLAVSLPAQDDESNSRAKVDVLARTLRERLNKSDDISKGVQESFERHARFHIEDANRAIQLLKDSILAESPFGEVKLIDPDIEGSIQILIEEVDRARDKLQILEGQTVASGSEKREDFIGRWGS